MEVPQQNSLTYNFNLRTESEVFDIVFRVGADKIESFCSCNYQNAPRLCVHRHYILARRSSRIQPEQVGIQTKLLRHLATTRAGKELIKEAKARFKEKETCRRCNSPRVIDTYHSAFGRLIRLFIHKNRRYFCLRCRWSW
jgi:hypothetical protein